MKRVVIAGALAITLATAGCSATISSKPFDQPTHSSPSRTVEIDPQPTFDQTISDEQFARFTRENIPLWSSYADSVLIEQGHAVCRSLDYGTRWMSVVMQLMNADGLPAYQAGYFIGLSIATYCTDHLSEITDR